MARGWDPPPPRFPPAAARTRACAVAPEAQGWAAVPRVRAAGGPSQPRRAARSPRRSGDRGRGGAGGGFPELGNAPSLPCLYLDSTPSRLSLIPGPRLRRGAVASALDLERLFAAWCWAGLRKLQGKGPQSCVQRHQWSEWTQEQSCGPSLFKQKPSCSGS